MIEMLIILLTLLVIDILCVCMKNKRIAELEKKINAKPNIEGPWHDVNEEPQGEYEIICQDEFEHVWLTDWREAMEQHLKGWEEYAACECIIRWAYIDDILPK